MPDNLELRHAPHPAVGDVGILDSPEPGKTPEKKSRKGLYAVIGGAAGIALAAGIGAGVNNANQAPRSEPTAEASADPAETAEPTPIPVEVADIADPHEFDVTADASPDQAAEAYRGMAEEIFSVLLNDSDWDEMINDNSGTTAGDFGRARAEERIAALFDAQWSPRWRDDVVLEKRYEFLVEGALGRWTNYEGGDSLTDTFALDSVKVLAKSKKELVLRIGMTEHYQGVERDQNNGFDSSVEKVSYELIDRRWRIVDWAPISSGE